MKNLYNIFKGQLITIWVFGVIGFFVAAAESYHSDFATFLLVFIPAALIFYTIGWLNFRKRKTKISRNVEKKDVGHSKLSSTRGFCVECGCENNTGHFCTNCGIKY